MECMVKLTVHPSFLPSLLGRSVDDLDTLCFRNNFISTAKQHEDREDRFCSHGDLKYYVLAKDGDTLIGETRVFKRTVVFNGQKIILGGIGSVATHPNKRKQGIATHMVKKAMKLLRSESCDIAYLCADIYALKALEFYEQFGFQKLANKHTFTGKSGTKYTDTDGMIAPIGSKKLCKKILAAATPFDIGIGNW